MPAAEPPETSSSSSASPDSVPRGNGPAKTTRREMILDVAADMFVANGFHATTVRDLADAVALSQPTLYYHVGHKTNILVLLHQSVLDVLLEPLEELAASDRDPRDKLRRFVEIQADAIERFHSRMVAFFRERHALPEEASALMDDDRRRLDAVLDDILSEGVAKGVFRDTPLASARIAIMGTLHWYAICVQPGSRRRPHEYADDFSRLLMAGIIADTPEARLSGFA